LRPRSGHNPEDAGSLDLEDTMDNVRRRMMTLAGALAMAGTLALPARTQDGDAWVTMEGTVAQRVRASFSAAGRADALTLESEGRIVVARLDAADVPRLSAWVHQELRHCGGFMGHATREAAFEEASRANRGDVHVPPALDYTIDNGPVVQALMADLQETNIRTTITSLSSFTTRYHNCTSGQQSARWILNQWRAFAHGHPEVKFATFTHTGYPTLQPSVILTIRGTQFPSEVVVLGAHQDSTVGGGCSTAPGADDDASGIASLSEVIRVALTLGYRPARTVKFMAYAAEEIGLRGSDEIAEAHQQQGVNVVGVFQLDMTNYHGSASDIYLVNDYTNAGQNGFVGNLVDSYLPGLAHGTTLCGYACSDHASWSSRGYAASFPFEAYFQPFPPSPGYDPFIHTPSDTLAQSGNNANHALKFSKLAAAYMAELAKGSLR
jgi:leucyl aminopeptidase